MEFRRSASLCRGDEVPQPDAVNDRTARARLNPKTAGRGRAGRRAASRLLRCEPLAEGVSSARVAHATTGTRSATSIDPRCRRCKPVGRKWSQQEVGLAGRKGYWAVAAVWVVCQSVAAGVCQKDCRTPALDGKVRASSPTHPGRRQRRERPRPGRTALRVSSAWVPPRGVGVERSQSLFPIVGLGPNLSPARMRAISSRRSCHIATHRSNWVF